MVLLSITVLSLLAASTCICNPVETAISRERVEAYAPEQQQQITTRPRKLPDVSSFTASVFKALRNAPSKLMRELVKDSRDSLQLYDRMLEFNQGPVMVGPKADSPGIGGKKTASSNQPNGWERHLGDLRAELHRTMLPHRTLSASSVYQMMKAMLDHRLNFLVTSSATSIGRDYHRAKKQRDALVFLARATYAAKFLVRELDLYPGTKLTKQQTLELYLCVKDAIDAFKGNLNLNEYDFSYVDQALETWFRSAKSSELGTLVALMEKALSHCASDYCNYFESVIILYDDQDGHQDPFNGFKSYEELGDDMKLSESLELVNRVFFKMQMSTQSATRQLFRSILDVSTMFHFTDMESSNQQKFGKENDTFVLHASIINNGRSEMTSKTVALDNRFRQYLRQVYLQEMKFPSLAYSMSFSFAQIYGRAMEFIKDRFGSHCDIQELVGKLEHWSKLYIFDENERNRLHSLFSKIFMGPNDGSADSSVFRRTSLQLAEHAESQLIGHAIRKHFLKTYQIPVSLDYPFGDFLVLSEWPEIAKIYRDCLEFHQDRSRQLKKLA